MGNVKMVVAEMVVYCLAMKRRSIYVNGVQFNATVAEFRYIRTIADRALSAQLYGLDTSVQEVLMDLEATHCNGCPLDLQALANAAPAHFNHDILGIRQHLDRDTGKLGGDWTPRHKRVPAP